MKKIVISVLLLSLMLVGCSPKENKPAQAASAPKSQNYQPKTYTGQFGKEFNVKIRDHQTGEVQENLKVKVNNVRTEEPADGYKTKLLLLDVTLENLGDKESNMYAVTASSFNLYNADGKEINPIMTAFKTKQETFEPSNILPKGKNEGTVGIRFNKSETVSQIIFKPGLLKADDSYIFKIK